MSTKTLTDLTIGDASKAQIIAFAKSEAGIEFTGEESRSYMESEVYAAMGWAEKDPSDGATHVVVKIGKEFGKSGEYAYRGGHRGNMFSIPREIETEIPIEYYHSIADRNRKGFRIQSLEKFKEGSPTDDRIETSGVPISVIRYVTKPKG